MAIADVQSPVTFIDTADNAVNKTIALGSNVTLGSLLLLIVSAVGHNVGSCTVSDSLGNTWTSVQGDAFWAGSSHGVGFFVAKVTTAGACTVTLNKNGATTSVAMELSEISGWDGTNALDGVTVIDTGNDATAPLTMSATSIADDFLFTAICGDPASAFTPGSPASGFTARSSLNNEATFNQLKTATRKPGATGTYSAGWPSMTNAGSNGWAVLAFAIKGQAGGGGGGTIVNPLSGRGGATAIPLVS